MPLNKCPLSISAGKGWIGSLTEGPVSVNALGEGINNEREEMSHLDPPCLDGARGGQVAQLVALCVTGCLSLRFRGRPPSLQCRRRQRHTGREGGHLSGRAEALGGLPHFPTPDSS